VSIATTTLASLQLHSAVLSGTQVISPASENPTFVPVTNFCELVKDTTTADLRYFVTWWSGDTTTFYYELQVFLSTPNVETGAVSVVAWGNKGAQGSKVVSSDCVTVLAAYGVTSIATNVAESAAGTGIGLETLLLSVLPEFAPSAAPSVSFSPSFSPSIKPSLAPSVRPTVVPTSAKPSFMPTVKTSKTAYAILFYPLF
jgi:xanthine/uracil/vitamin C permease (AzgA family)